MTSNILNQLGLGSIDIGIILIAMFIIMIILIIMVLIVIIHNIKLKKKLKVFMSGKNAASLEKEIIGLQEDNKFLKNVAEQSKKEIRTLNKQLDKAFQKSALVKYDAYQQMGGLLSFSLALLDEDNNGIIFNSVHSTEGCYTYTKEIKMGLCDQELSNEEKIALERAMGV